MDWVWQHRKLHAMAEEAAAMNRSNRRAACTCRWQVVNGMHESAYVDETRDPNCAVHGAYGTVDDPETGGRRWETYIAGLKGERDG